MKLGLGILGLRQARVRDRDRARLRVLNCPGPASQGLHNGEHCFLDLS